MVGKMIKSVYTCLLLIGELFCFEKEKGALSLPNIHNDYSAVYNSMNKWKHEWNSGLFLPELTKSLILRFDHSSCDFTHRK